MAILREIAIYLIFVYLLLMVGYGNRDPWAGHFYRNVKNLLAHGHWSYGTNGFDLYNVCIIIRNLFSLFCCLVAQVQQCCIMCHMYFNL